MGRMAELYEEIITLYNQDLMEADDIAARLGIPLDMVEAAITEHLKDAGDRYDESMDGDHESALASAGWGVDECYIMDNDYFDSFDSEY